MTTVIDQRIRIDAEHDPVDPDVFFGSTLPAAIDAHASCILPALDFVAPRPLRVEVGGEVGDEVGGEVGGDGPHDGPRDTRDARDGGPWTLWCEDGRVRIERGDGRDVVAHIRLSRAQLDDLVHDQQTFMSMWAANDFEQVRGNIGHCCDWWLVWRAALDGTPIYTPGSVRFDVDLGRSFTPGDDVETMRHFLHDAGFLHLRGVFSADEMRAVSADMDHAVGNYEQGDGRSWWARTSAGDTRLVRMQGFDRESAVVQELLGDSRFLDLAAISGAGHQFGRRRAQNKIEALFKPIGVTEGISDIPWHKDCGIGRHSYECCGMTVGISVTGADAVSGQLHVLAGSHRALVWSGIRQPDLDLPDIPLPTESGDVTVHLSCTMHMAQPPVERERRVMYSGFSLPPLDAADTGALASGRARLGAVRESAPLTVLDRHFKS